MKNNLLFLSLFLFSISGNAQSIEQLQLPGKIEMEIKGQFKSVEENFDTYWHGRPPSKEHGQELQERGRKLYTYIHPDTITYTRSGKKKIASQKVFLEYRLNPEGYIYTIDKTNSRTGHRIGRTTSEWKNGKLTKMDEGGKSQYFKLYQYNSDGRIETSTRLNKRNNKVYTVSQYAYGDNPKDVTITGTSRKGKLNKQIVTKYSSKKKATTKFLNSKKVITEIFEIKYNRRGDLKNIKTIDVKTKKESLTKFKYKYDKQGNWTSKEKTTDGLLMEKRSRVFVY